MAPYTTYSVRKLILRFFQRGKTQREIADLTEPARVLLIESLSISKLAAKGLNHVQGDDPELMKDQFKIC